MILQVSHIKKSFLEEPVIKEATFHLEDYEKAALVGINGAGKSTLFRIIAGQMEADEGFVTLSSMKTMGYLSQHADLDSDRDIYHEVLSVREHILDLENDMRTLEAEMNRASGDELTALIHRHSQLQEMFDKENGYAIQSEVTGVLKGLGFTEREFTLPVASLSGGEKTRVSLARLLLTKPDLLLLDEPTNHLDISSVVWLENYILNYKGSVFIVSHDRYFLDRTVTKVIDLERGTAYVYSGNYTAFTEKKEFVWKAKLKAYENQQREIRHQEEVIEKLRSYNREKSIRRAESREKMLDKIEVLEKPTELHAEMSLQLTPNVLSGNDVLTVSGLSKAFDEKVLFEHIDIQVKRGERLAIIGDNGTGKTTLLKIINGLLPQDQGTLTLGSNVYLGYYDQEHQVLHEEKTIFDEIQDEYPSMDNTKVRNFLAAFLFTGDDVYKQIRELSGGERGRVSLAKLMLSQANTLILDEPTNHLDMVSKEILENALKHYEGTLIFVSHDRYFINSIATRILELYQKSFINYIGNYDYYLEKRDLFHQQYDETPVTKETVSSSEAERRIRKEEQAKNRKRERELLKLEEEIAALEEKLQQHEEELQDPEIAANSAELNRIIKDSEAVRKALDQKYEAWESLME